MRSIGIPNGWAPSAAPRRRAGWPPGRRGSSGLQRLTWITPADVDRDLLAAVLGDSLMVW